MRNALAILFAFFAVTILRASEPVAIPAYEAIPHIALYATPEEFRTALRDTRFRLTRVSYSSDGLTVFAYVYAPVHARSAPLPVIVFNRGSYVWKEFAGEYLTVFHRLASAGFIVVAPMYRGSGGAQGRDEMGGADVDDLLNVMRVIRHLRSADADHVFMYGESRGGMMTYQAIREHFPMRAAAVYGAFTDLETLPHVAETAKAIWPDYEQRRSEIVTRRSAIDWAEKLDTPILIMHGSADKDVPPSQSLALAQRLQALGKEYELIVRAGSNHILSDWRAGRDANAIAWFRRHMR